jgi:hypothetical protein
VVFHYGAFRVSTGEARLMRPFFQQPGLVEPYSLKVGSRELSAKPAAAVGIHVLGGEL